MSFRLAYFISQLTLLYFSLNYIILFLDLMIHP